MSRKISRYYKDRPNKSPLVVREDKVADSDAIRARCIVEMSSYKDLKTLPDLADLMQSSINALIHQVIDSKSFMALGYGVSLQRVILKDLDAKGLNQKLTVDERLQDGDIELNVTEQDLKALAAAPTREIQIRIVNKMVSKTTTYIESMPQIDVPVDKATLAPVRDTMKLIEQDYKERNQDMPLAPPDPDRFKELFPDE